MSSLPGGWQVILCDPIWHVSSRSGEACGELLYPVTLLYLTIHIDCVSAAVNSQTVHNSLIKYMHL